MLMVADDRSVKVSLSTKTMRMKHPLRAGRGDEERRSVDESNV